MNATMDEMIKEVGSWLFSQETNREARHEFLHTKYEDLPLYHHTLGRDIRNHFKLWTVKWEPEIVDGVDVSENHPDAISMTVIREVWKRTREHMSHLQ